MWRLPIQRMFMGLSVVGRLMIGSPISRPKQKRLWFVPMAMEAIAKIRGHPSFRVSIPWVFIGMRTATTSCYYHHYYYHHYQHPYSQALKHKLMPWQPKKTLEYRRITTRKSITATVGQAALFRLLGKLCCLPLHLTASKQGATTWPNTIVQSYRT